MAWFRAGGGGIPSSLKAEMNDVLNKKFGTFLQNYPPEGWPDNVNLLGPLPIKTASGAIASFSDGADDVPLKSGVFGIVPTGGGGTPSSPVPIVGRSGMTISHCGKNLLLRGATSDTINGVTFTVNSDGSVTVNGTASANTAFSICNVYLKAGSYILSGAPPTGISTTYEFQVLASNGTTYREYGSGRTFTLAEGTDGLNEVRILIRRNYTASNLVFYPQLELGSTASEYEPINGVGDTVSFGSTVYGGEYSMDGTLKAYSYYPSYNGETLTGKWVSSMDTYAQGTSPSIGAQVVDMSGDNYEETEIEPTPINSRLGANNLWCDTGDAEVEYYADINLALNQ